MVIDKNGKLFGKLGISSFIIILVIIFSIIGAGYKYMKSKTITPLTSEEDIEIQFYSEEVPYYVVEAISSGDLVKDPNRNAIFGYVKDIQIDNSHSITTNSQGVFVDSPKPDFKSITVTVEGKGIYSDSGTTFNNVEYAIGKWISLLRLGNSTLENARIYNIEKK